MHTNTQAGEYLVKGAAPDVNTCTQYSTLCVLLSITSPLPAPNPLFFHTV
jgi:hypothetical protein